VDTGAFVFLAREQYSDNIVVIGLFSSEEKAKAACDARNIRYCSNADGTVDPLYVFHEWEAFEGNWLRQNPKLFYQLVSKEIVQ